MVKDTLELLGDSDNKILPEEQQKQHGKIKNQNNCVEINVIIKCQFIKHFFGFGSCFLAILI